MTPKDYEVVADLAEYRARLGDRKSALAEIARIPDGETADLNEFLFGSERAALAAVRPVLMGVQRGACF